MTIITIILARREERERNISVNGKHQSVASCTPTGEPAAAQACALTHQEPNWQPCALQDENLVKALTRI